MSEWYAGWYGDWRKEWYGRSPQPDFGGWGPPGAATLKLVALNKGYRVRYSWITHIDKARSGSEKRASIIDAPRQSYSGDALLLGDDRRDAQTLLAQYAALGSQFLLGLQHESLTIAEVNGNVVTIHGSTADSDWARQRGQRVVCIRDADGERRAVNAVIQSSTTTTITLDVAPGSMTEIMPTMPVLLEPEQEFARYRTTAETWRIQARASLVDFAPDLAEIALGPVTSSAAFDNVFVTSRKFGLAGNQITFEMHTGGPANGTLIEADGIVSVTFQAGVTTLGNLATLLAASSFVKLTGTWNPADTIAAGDVIDPAESLTGGSDAGPVGAGAVLTMYDSRPVWDRPIEGDQSDSVHALTKIIDHGGVPYQVAIADQPDWGRGIAVASLDRREWQWVKKFIDDRKGMQKAFWLPTWREDLEVVSLVGTTLTVVGLVTAWYPRLRDRVQLEQEDGVCTYARITSAVPSGVNTVLELDAGLPSASPLQMVSWLEFCRFDSDDFDVTIGQRGWFAMQTTAHVVPVRVDAAGVLDYDAAEKSWERSQPREFADIAYEGITHRIAFGVRDLQVGPILYTAIAASRNEIVPAGTMNDSALELTLPADHPLSVRYTQLGTPPQKVSVTLWSLQRESDEVERLWDGEASGASVDDDWTEMTFRVPDRRGRALLQVLPSITVGRTCPVQLYGRACGIGRTGSGPTGIPHKQATTVLYVNGRTVRVDLPSVPAGDPLRADWAEAGEFYFPTTEARMTVAAQDDVSPGVSTVAELTLQSPIVGLKVGSAVEVYAGCKKRIVEDCDAKFGNRQNFRGAPDLPEANPFTPGSSGVDGLDRAV